MLDGEQVKRCLMETHAYLSVKAASLSQEQSKCVVKEAQSSRAVQLCA